MAAGSTSTGMDRAFGQGDNGVADLVAEQSLLVILDAEAAAPSRALAVWSMTRAARSPSTGRAFS